MSAIELDFCNKSKKKYNETDNSQIWSPEDECLYKFRRLTDENKGRILERMEVYLKEQTKLYLIDRKR